MAYFTYGLNHPGNTASTEQIGGDIRMTTANTFLTGDNITYSAARGSSALKLTGTYSAVTGGFSNLYSRIDSSGVLATDGNGVVNIKALTVNSAALTDGEIYGAQFVVRQGGTVTSAAQASFIGCEGWFYETDSSVLRTGIGGNFGWHNDSTAAAHGAGSVHRGIQIFCDNAGTSAAEESTGLALWNKAGTITNAIAVINSGSGFTNFANFFSNDGTPAATGTYSSGVAANPTGYIAVKVGANTRYIYLFTTLPT